jgi:hypothetical protein
MPHTFWCQCGQAYHSAARAFACEASHRAKLIPEAELTRLRAVNKELVGGLRGAVRVLDRILETVGLWGEELEALASARAALSKATNQEQ